MNERERLVELIVNSDLYDSYECGLCDAGEGACDSCYAEKLAKHLLANGVIVPPCKVGDTVYYLGGLYNRLVKSATVQEIIANFNGVSDLLVISENNVAFENSIDIFYFTREEAEAVLAERSKG